MAGFQFMHIESYARSPSALRGSRRAAEGKKRSKGTGGWSARQVLAEALREPGACGHVEQPQQPEVLLGDLDQLARELDELERNPPKGQRKDTPILMAGVLSAPWPPDDPRGVEWRMDAMHWLRREFGTNLAVVVAHNDEPHDHMHFYVKAPGWLSVKPIHPGTVARAKVAEEGGDGKAQREAFNGAMRAMQDRYQDQVGMAHGMSRVGPRRRRLTRSAWVEEQRQAEVLAEARKRAKLVEAEVAEARDGIERERRQIRAERAALELQRQEVAADQERIRLLAASLSPVEEQRAAERHAELQEQKRKKAAEAIKEAAVKGRAASERESAFLSVLKGPEEPARQTDTPSPSKRR